MRGKDKCKILKEIRRRIADENDIPYVTRECGFHGECKGTCPRCESELQYLERELARRRSLGKRVSVAALCVGISLAAAGCSPTGQEKTEIKTESNDIAGAMDGPVQGTETVELDGDVAWIDESGDSSDEIYVTEGEVAWTESECESSVVLPS